MRNVRPGFADVSVHFAHDRNVLVAIEKRKLLLPSRPPAAGVSYSVGFETGVGQDNDQPLRAFVGGRDWDVLFGDQLGKFGRGA